MEIYFLKRALLGFVYPCRCPFCDEIIKASEYYHSDCLELDFYRNSGKDTFCCVYNEKSRPLITKAKEKSDGYAVSAAARLLYNSLLRNNILHDIDIIVPVPPRKAALRKRGYSFPALLAKETAEIAGIKYSGKTLKLLREPEEQKNLSAAERRENLNGAFAVRDKKFHCGNVLVIDDVSTTGATLNEAKQALSKCAGAVYTAAFAKTLYMSDCTP